ncbi:MAG: anaerobic glycerol-3-phosphate dehydrogenase subunit GlpA [Actinomycetota bacterium]|nr:anaerobic glycerol-3-phosphate dehydrogenase subunit GlpA [Actinomycetota bacterium]
MADLQTDVLVIGGGSTGAGVARDAAMRGLGTVLVERRDLADGTTGRFHGLLHSGGRYVVKDPPAARECVPENAILRRIAADCIEDTGGLFVTTPPDDPAYAEQFLAGCRATGVPVEELSVVEALRREPRLNPRISRAFLVPDAAIDPWKTVWACARSAQAYGARILTYHRVVDLVRSGDRVVGALLANDLTGEELGVEAAVVVNASGAWAGQIARMAGCDVEIQPGKGIMIAMNHRLVQTVINRCKMPADGDILVPIRTVSVIGTTDVRVPDPDEAPVTQGEVEQMLDEGEVLVPGFRHARALRVWAGVRPLFQETKPGLVRDTRDVSRSHTLLDHARRDGVEGLLTITGGKTTTFRLMAEVTVDAVCEHLGVKRPCRTHEEPLPGSQDGGHYWLGARLASREPVPRSEQIVCECELITRRKLEEAIDRRRTVNLDDIRRTLRLGMGPCQGGFCIYRATGILHARHGVDAETANGSLLSFLQERWKGVHPILYGDQLRQARLDDWIFQGVLNVRELAR